MSRVTYRAGVGVRKTKGSPAVSADLAAPNNILEQPNYAAQVPSWVGYDYEQRSAWEDDKDGMTFHDRAKNSHAMRNLLDEMYEKATLKDDLGKRHQSYPSTTLARVLQLGSRDRAGCGTLRMTSRGISCNYA